MPLLHAGNRRRRRTTTEPSLALHYQLTACCDTGEVVAMAMADDDGVPLAMAGEVGACRDVAGKMIAVAPRIREVECTVLGAGKTAWDVSMKKVTTDTGDVVVCAIGGSAEGRRRQIQRTTDGVQRIFAGR
jgi:hypothetical protein